MDSALAPEGSDKASSTAGNCIFSIQNSDGFGGRHVTEAARLRIPADERLWRIGVVTQKLRHGTRCHASNSRTREASVIQQALSQVWAQAR